MANEYISREAAIKKLRGESIAIFPMSYSYGIIAASEEIKSIPAADVVPVVRCRDCVFYKPQKQSSHWNNTKRFCNRTVTMVMPPDGFCSHGARMDGDGDGV